MANLQKIKNNLNMRQDSIKSICDLLQKQNGFIDIPMLLKDSGYIWGMRLVNDSPCIINGYYDNGREILILVDTLTTKDLFALYDRFVAKC